MWGVLLESLLQRVLDFGPKLVLVSKLGWLERTPSTTVRPAGRLGQRFGSTLPGRCLRVGSWGRPPLVTAGDFYWMFLGLPPSGLPAPGGNDATRQPSGSRSRLSATYSPNSNAVWTYSLTGKRDLKAKFTPETSRCGRRSKAARRLASVANLQAKVGLGYFIVHEMAIKFLSFLFL